METSPWYQRLPMFGNLGMPIALKEVRSLIRRNRYFWSQFIYLAFLAVGVIIVITGAQGTVTKQEAVGQQLFAWFFRLQAFLVALVFPAFAATSFSSEKAERSFELLITTDLRPHELVWGKFIGIFGNCCYFLMVTLPLLGICILFGGVSIWDAFENYLLLVLEAALLCIYGIWVSSCTASNLRAIMATYAPVLFFGFVPMGLMQGMRAGSGGTQGVFSAILDAFAGQELLVMAIVAYAAIGFFVFCFVAAVLRLSSPESNQETPLRVYGLIALLVGLGLAAWYVQSSRTVRPGWGPSDDIEAVFALAMLLAFVLPIAVLSYSSGRIETPLRTSRAAGQRPWVTRLCWVLLPGGARGYIFALLFVAVAYFGVHWIGTDIASLSGVLLSDAPDARSVLAYGRDVFGAIAFGFVGYGAFSFLLSTAGVRGFLNWAIVLATAVLLSLLAVVYWVQVESEQLPLSPLFSTSIVVSVMTYTQGAEGRDWLIRWCMVVHATAGALCFFGGLVVLRMRRLPALGVFRPGQKAAPMPVRES